ncbi:hypothetical protein KVR01_001141 [Diaporthe batatas]|uniref:uncharacterized protein n=1 Tax=Diaporthe batatas TaxID=748121 RepID=UPI001D056A83|nr:uncharacterized protein KVR01_001141 [Diaporthe batatas]KAG8168392.1 hypothetical protein KVR01_001141 [Diaporthe batatas]
MSFGFGIGDIIACSEVAWKTINALKSAGSDFEGLRLDLASLTSVLQALEAEAKGPMPLINTASAERQYQMRLLLRNCKESMEDLQGVVGKYRGWNADKKRDFVAWMKFAAKDKRGPREKLAVHTASINIFLTTLSHGSLARLEFLIKNGSQAAQQTRVPDGPRDLDLSASEAPWSGSHSSSKREGAVWQNIGRSLQSEGITDKDIHAFQEEIKAYARYLVRGETPFWKEPVLVSGSNEVHKVAELREQEDRRRQAEEKEQMRRRIEERRRKEDEWNRRRQREEAIIRIEVEEERKDLGYEKVAEARRQGVQVRPPASISAREEEEAKKSKLREELKQARRSQYLGAAVVGELEPELGKAKIREEEEMKRRKEGPAVIRSRIDQEDDVVSLAYTFQGLFDFEAEPTQAAPEVPAPEKDSVSTTIPIVDEDKEFERERRTARVYEIQKRLGKLVDKHDRYIQEGRRDRVADLEVNDIPDQVRLLKLEGVDVSHERAWKWTHRCNVCHFLIPNDHYHCVKCGGGNWDACQECWNEGARCNGPGHHRITFNGRIVV